MPRTMLSYSLRDVVLYIVKRLGEVEGLKKLMKLLFLVQYEAKRSLLGKRRVVKYLYGHEPITRTDFYIWWYGPFSNDVYDLLDKETDRGTLVLDADEYGRTLIKAGDVEQVELPEVVKQRVDEALDRYGDWIGTQLELYVLRNILMMKEPEEKEDWYGVPVDDYFRRKNIALEEEDLQRAHRKHSLVKLRI